MKQNKNTTAAKNNNQNTAKGASMNAAQELALVSAAKNGSINARDTLFLAYQDEIISTHTFSACGTNPTKFGKGRNKYGHSYEEDSGRIFEVFVNALDKFDPSLVNMSSFTKTTPFLSYLKYEISHRAMDVARSESVYRDRHTLMSDLVKNVKGKERSINDSRSDEEILNVAQEKALENAIVKTDLFDGNADDYKNLQLQEMTSKLISLCDKDSKEYATLVTFLDALGYAKNVIPEVAARMKTTKQTVHNTFKRVLAKVPTQMAQEFLDILKAA